MKKIILITIIVIFTWPSLRAQMENYDEQAVEVLDKALSRIMEKDFAIYFEAIAFSVKDPTEIFDLPAYRVHLGGHMIASEDKFEMHLGIIKALSDGKIRVMVDETSQTMIIDSVRQISGMNDSLPDITALLGEDFVNLQLVYQGEEKINGRQCHKIRANYPSNKELHVIYWVEKKSGEILLMGEYQYGDYDAYWFKKITDAPKNYQFNIRVPEKETDKLYGYEVVDFRYIKKKL